VALRSVSFVAMVEIGLSQFLFGSVLGTRLM
jgi:hypothetical protein